MRPELQDLQYAGLDASRAECMHRDSRTLLPRYPSVHIRASHDLPAAEGVEGATETGVAAAYTCVVRTDHCIVMGASSDRQHANTGSQVRATSTGVRRTKGEAGA